MSICWFEKFDKQAILIGLMKAPSLLKLIPPIHAHLTAPPGRFNVLSVDAKRVLVVDGKSHQIYIVNHFLNARRHIAGCGKRGHLDGPLDICRMHSPSSACLDPVTHEIYVADRGNHCIRKINLSSGLMSTVCGNCVKGSRDSIEQSRQYIDSPYEVKFTAPHHLIIQCADNSVRRWDIKSGLLETILVGS